MGVKGCKERRRNIGGIGVIGDIKDLEGKGEWRGFGKRLNRVLV